ncbi:hypothetical protein BJX63DRAFT_433452 [Aspergillus granulosus]|uniref:GFO/IDH/MocA-like oxidoreductase domain-containing protein n=1 Tax=Aspergillus granulosus TaxID=176169 RepID=A0ABR4H7L6_9EURO
MRFYLHQSTIPNSFSPSKLNIGVVGIGRMGQHHALNILYHVPRARLLAVCSRHPTSLSAPKSTSSQKLESLIKTAEKHKETKLMVGFVRRFENYGDARSKIQAGLIGTPLIIRSQGTEKLDKTGFFINYARVSGGIFLDTVIHDIDLTLSFFGDSSVPKSCYATGLIAHHHEMAEFNDVDNAVGVVEFWGGKTAYYYHSRTTMHGYDNCTEIVGSEGKIGINLVPVVNEVTVSGKGGIVQEAYPSWIYVVLFETTGDRV